MAKCSDEIKQFMANNEAVTWEDIESRVIQPSLEIDENTSLDEEAKIKVLVEKGLPEWSEGRAAYGLAKACVNAYTLALSKQYPNLLLNACSPGFIGTDLTRPWAEKAGKKLEEIGALPVEKGTIAPVHLLMNDITSSGQSMTCF